jgi:peptidoglycan/LPS O-acetylase OafA/YrhL
VKRTGPPVDHLDALDGVRAIAAYLVIGTHVGFNTGRSLDNSPVAPFLARMDFGVTLFFLLSGFLLYRPYAIAAFGRAAPPATLPFWWRRLLRIVPAYWIAIAITLTVLTRRPASGSDWASYLTLTQTYDGHDVDPNLTQMWTLAVELGFYAALPILARIAAPIARRIGVCELRMSS